MRGTPATARSPRLLLLISANDFVTPQKRGRSWDFDRNRATSAAFTLIELLVVITVIGILAGLLLPVLSKAKQKSQGIYCLNNGKQMMQAMVMYTSDNNDFFPPNPDDGTIRPGYNWCSGSAGKGQYDEFNPDILRDPTRSLLATDLAGNISVFHCPGDKRMGLYQGNDPKLLGRSVPAARTFSMSQAVGTIDPLYDATNGNDRSGGAHSGVPKLPVNGPWLNNNENHRHDSPWMTYSKMSGIGAPGPSMLWVLVDEGVQGLNDAAFAFGMERPIWYDVPGTYHNGGCGFAFADGHSESHAWHKKGDKTTPKTRITDPGDLADWTWMRQRTSANVSGVNPPPY
ncbi:MAG: type secretion protein [Pedosphaera sp.]|nr:type secretion protein [Pedosphaera sp.]